MFSIVFALFLTYIQKIYYITVVLDLNVVFEEIVITRCKLFLRVL